MQTQKNYKNVGMQYGCSNSLQDLKKNDVVQVRGRLSRVGGFFGKRISLHEYTLEIVQPEDYV